MKWDEEYRLAHRRHRLRRETERLLAPRFSRRLTMEMNLRRSHLFSDAEICARVLAELGPLTDQERALDARIDREHRLTERALNASTARENMRTLAAHIQRTYGVPYVKDLTDDQLDAFAAWVARREELKERRAHRGAL